MPHDPTIRRSGSGRGRSSISVAIRLRAFLDASLVIGLLEENERAKRFESRASEEEREWFVSPLVRMESLVRVLAEDDSKGRQRVEEIVGSTHSLPLTDAVFDRAAHIRAKFGLKALDAIHVATALEHGCAEIWTADARLARPTVPGLAIRLVA